MKQKIIKNVLLSEFHATEGAQILFQYPEEVKIDISVDFLIPKDELCGKMMMIEYMHEFYLLNMPILLRSTVYARIKYIFSTSVIVEKAHFHSNPEQYFEIVKKLSYLITQIHLSKNVIYKHESNKIEQNQMNQLIQAFQKGLKSSPRDTQNPNQPGYQFLQLGNPTVQSSVPELKRNFILFPIVDIKALDRSKFSLQVLPILEHINGVNSISVIQDLLQIPMTELKKSIREVVETNNIVLLDMVDIEELRDILRRFYTDLNNSQQCFLSYDDNEYIYLQILEPKTACKSPEIRYSMVPFPLVDLRQGIQTNFNPILKKILLEINGVNSVGNICEKGKPFTSQQVKATLSEMVEFNLITLLDMIHQTNQYILKESFFKQFQQGSLVAQDASKQILDIHNILQDYETGAIPKNGPFEAIPYKILQKLYFSFSRGTTLQQYVQKNKDFLKYANLLRLIRFGQIHDFLVRLHEYPLVKNQAFTYFDSNNQKEYLQKFVRCSERFNEEEKVLQKGQPVGEGNFHAQQHSIEHSRKYERGEEKSTRMVAVVSQNERIKDANDTMSRLISSQAPLDEIKLIFNLDMAGFKKLVDDNIVIFHK